MLSQMSLTWEVILQSFTRQISQQSWKLWRGKSLAQSDNLHLYLEKRAKYKLLLVPDGDNNVSEEEVTGAHSVIQSYLPALCNF